MTMKRAGEHGLALIVVLLTIVLLSALGVALVLATTAEARIAGNFRIAQQTLYAAEAAADRAIDELALVPDWTALLGGGVLSSFVDGSPSGARQLDDGSVLDLTGVLNQANCQKTAPCSTGDMDAVTEDRPWGLNNPRWTLFAFAPLRTLLPAGAASTAHYVVVMAGDDPGEVDNDPARDGIAGMPGAGILALRAEAFGQGGAHKVVELTVARGSSAVRVLSWRELR
jgi:type IV pilus assembly PilX-like protein